MPEYGTWKARLVFAAMTMGMILAYVLLLSLPDLIRRLH